MVEFSKIFKLESSINLTTYLILKEEKNLNTMKKGFSQLIYHSLAINMNMYILLKECVFACMHVRACVRVCKLDAGEKCTCNTYIVCDFTGV